MSERTRAIRVVAIGLSVGLGTDGAQAPSRAKGTFDVKLAPVAEEAGTTLASARLKLDKTFQGDLVGTSKGEMWSADTAVKGSAGYVAIEKVSGTLRGRKGSFTLLHQGTMRRGADFQLRIVVVPESGTDELAGLTGTMAIRIEKGAHFYEFDYTLPEASR
jgi:hypothetical protein